MRRWVALVLLVFAATAAAHDVPPSVVQFDIGRDVVDVELQLPLKELSVALGRDSTLASGLVEGYVLNHLHLKSPTGVQFATAVESWSLSHTDNRNWVSNDWLVMRLRARPPAGADTERFTFDYDVIVHTVVSHKVLVYVRRDIRHGLLGETPQAIGLIAFQQTQLTVDGSGGSWWVGFVKLWQLGVEHIAQGTDHLLFLLVLLLPAPLVASRSRWGGARPVGDSFWNIAKTVSGFTIGHSITLALGALGVVAIPREPPSAQ
ncbi:MAG TPA: HupE/UreJ family protein [Steroidobacteraceae bacterium]